MFKPERRSRVYQRVNKKGKKKSGTGPVGRKEKRTEGGKLKRGRAVRAWVNKQVQ